MFPLRRRRWGCCGVVAGVVRDFVIQYGSKDLLRKMARLAERLRRQFQVLLRKRAGSIPGYQAVVCSVHISFLPGHISFLPGQRASPFSGASGARLM
jgi:hypothetical protein